MLCRFLLAANLFFALQLSFAQEPEPPSQLEKIHQQVEERSRELERFTGEQRALEKRLTELQQQVRKLKTEEAALKVELEKARQAIAAAEQEIALTGARIAATEKRSLQRLRALYFERPGKLVFKLLRSGRRDELSRSAFLLLKVREYDRRLLRELAEARAQREREKEELAAELARRQELAEKIEAKRQALDAKLKTQSGLVQELKKKKTAIEQSLTALRAQALRLETVVMSLTGGPGDEAAPRAATPAAAEKTPPAGNFEGGGLARLKGQLVPPVEGRVLQRFGRRRHAEFSDFIFTKGLEFNALAFSKVRAIAGGRVMYVGRMPGYGTVVILDHGERYYSLYGRLAKSLVEQGQVLERTAEVGIADQPDDEKSSNFYFEIRKNGQPVNPQQFYTRKFAYAS